jgi:hypothetical protein
MNNFPHREIAKALNVTRQHVSSLVKRGLPTSSLESAKAWYQNNVRTRYSKGRHRRISPVALPLTREEDTREFDLLDPEWKPSPIKLVDLPERNVVSDEDVEAWLDSKVETVEDAVRLSGVFLQAIRLNIDWMPHVMAERCNPLDPDLARRELEHWLDTFNRECFTDHESETPDRDSFPKA